MLVAEVVVVGVFLAALLTVIACFGYLVYATILALDWSFLIEMGLLVVFTITFAQPRIGQPEDAAHQDGVLVRRDAIDQCIALTHRLDEARLVSAVDERGQQP